MSMNRISISRHGIAVLTLSWCVTAACKSEQRSYGHDAAGSGATAGAAGSSTAGSGGTGSSECEPGALFCSGKTVRRCAGDGLSSEEEKVCQDDEYCSTTTGECEHGVCEPDAPACDGDRATTCNATGDGYLDGGEECGADTICDSGTCKLCPPGKQFCQDQDVKQCSEDGLASTVVDTCVDQACVSSSGSALCTGECAPLQKRCSGNGVQTCSATGDWGTAVACSGSTPYCGGSGECRLGVTAITAGTSHTCALLSTGNVRCWGNGGTGRLGYGNTNNIGDDETPADAGYVNFGTATPVTQISAGASHTCAVFSNGDARCWGSSLGLGYGNSNNIGDDETPSTSLPTGPFTQIAAGGNHTCALLNQGSLSVRCWGQGGAGKLGYGNTDNILSAANASGVSVGGAPTQIALGDNHTCALLSNGSVRCWGAGIHGRLGYGNTNNIGDDLNETPASAGDVNVGGTVTQIAVGGNYTCALLSNGSVRCWGGGSSGQLGYGNTNTIGDDETPASAGDVDVGGTVTQIAAGSSHTCALLSNGSVRCWGYGSHGQLGYGNTNSIGNEPNETPASAGDVDVGGTVIQIAARGDHTCALLSNGNVRCWGNGADGRLGYGNTNSIGDDETPASAGDVPVF